MDCEAAPRAPLVTCAMITIARRHALARESARCFAQQSFRDSELLVITSPAFDGAPQDERELAMLEAAVREEAGARARFVHSEQRTIGAKRNLAFAHARGNFLCQWDDDDRFHPDRIQQQLLDLQTESASGAVASFLTEVVHLFVEERAAYVCNWRRAPQGGHPGTGLFRSQLAARYPETGELSMRGEDTAFAMAVRAEGSVVSPSRGPLYLYRFHGGNTWSGQHHKSLVEQMAISRALLQRREAALRPWLEQLGLPAGTELRGSNGAAFVF